MDRLSEERAKGQACSSPRQHSQEESTGKGDLGHIQNTKSSLKIQEWFLNFLTRILSNPEMSEDRYIDPPEELHNFTNSTD